MPGRSNLTTRNLNQTALYWANPVNDGFGKYTFDDAEEIDVRWEDKQELFMALGGREEVSRAVVYVGIDIEPGEYLMLGTTDDLTSGAEEPYEHAAAFEVRAFSKVSDLGGTRFVRKVWL